MAIEKKAFGTIPLTTEIPVDGVQAKLTPGDGIVIDGETIKTDDTHIKAVKVDKSTSADGAKKLVENGGSKILFVYADGDSGTMIAYGSGGEMTETKLPSQSNGTLALISDVSSALANYLPRGIYLDSTFGLKYGEWASAANFARLQALWTDGPSTYYLPLGYDANFEDEDYGYTPYPDDINDVSFIFADRNWVRRHVTTANADKANTSTVTALAKVVDSKANKATVALLSSRVDTAESTTIPALESRIATLEAANNILEGL